MSFLYPLLVLGRLPFFNVLQCKLGAELVSQCLLWDQVKMGVVNTDIIMDTLKFSLRKLN